LLQLALPCILDLGSARGAGDVFRSHQVGARPFGRHAGAAPDDRCAAGRTRVNTWESPRTPGDPQRSPGSSDPGFNQGVSMLFSRVMGVALAVATVAVSACGSDVAAPASTCCQPTDGNAFVPGGNLGNQNYSSLAMITRDNVGNLGPAGRTHVSAVPPATDHTGSQATPIVVDGVIYLPTPAGGAIAVDGATGETVWKWQPEWADGGGPRGLSLGDGRLYTTGE